MFELFSSIGADALSVAQSVIVAGATPPLMVAVMYSVTSSPTASEPTFHIDVPMLNEPCKVAEPVTVTLAFCGVLMTTPVAYDGPLFFTRTV